MKSLNDILTVAKQNNSTVSQTSEDWLIEHGYIKTEAYGWEKPEYLEMFGMDVNATGIPAQLYDEYDYKEARAVKKNEYGEKIGFEVARERVATGKKFSGVSANYLLYKNFKRRIYGEWYQKKFNEPPPIAELI